MIQIFTSANLRYLSQALVLLDSVRRYEPSARFTLLLVDAYPEDEQTQSLLSRFDDVIPPEELLGKDYLQWMFRYDVVEACTAVKGAGLCRLLESGDPVVYLDPDTAMFSDLGRISLELRRHSVVLTPHQMRPWPSLRFLNDEITSLRTGAYNLGFLAVAPTEEGRSVARWWAARLEEWSLDQPAAGLFTDQKWMNLIPAMFDGARVLRDPGMNVASWNLHERPLALDAAGRYLVDGSPLCFFHFTKARHVGSVVSRTKMVNNPLAAHLWGWYLAELARFDAELPEHEWRFGHYWDTTRSPISPGDRERFRSLPEEHRPMNPYVR